MGFNFSKTWLSTATGMSLSYFLNRFSCSWSTSMSILGPSNGLCSKYALLPSILVKHQTLVSAVLASLGLYAYLFPRTIWYCFMASLQGSAASWQDFKQVEKVSLFHPAAVCHKFDWKQQTQQVACKVSGSTLAAGAAELDWATAGANGAWSMSTNSSENKVEMAAKFWYSLLSLPLASFLAR